MNRVQLPKTKNLDIDEKLMYKVYPIVLEVYNLYIIKRIRSYSGISSGLKPLWKSISSFNSKN